MWGGIFNLGPSGKRLKEEWKRVDKERVEGGGRSRGKRVKKERVGGKGQRSEI